MADLGAAADEGRVGVIEFAGDGAAGGGGNEFQFADESATPGGVDARAEIAFHGGKLG